MKHVLLLLILLASSAVWAGEADLLANLPPDPGAAGKATLAGIDSDNDGVRDDVQRWIALTYPNSQKIRAALQQRTKTMQRFLLDATNLTQAYADATQMDNDYDCLSYIDMNRAYTISREHKAIFLNTYLRSKAWLQVDQTLSGKSFNSTPFNQWKQNCNFNPDVMPN